MQKDIVFLKRDFLYANTYNFKWRFHFVGLIRNGIFCRGIC